MTDRQLLVAQHGWAFHFQRWEVSTLANKEPALLDLADQAGYLGGESNPINQEHQLPYVCCPYRHGIQAIYFPRLRIRHYSGAGSGLHPTHWRAQ